MQKIILYGASYTGSIAIEHYGSESVECFCDGDKNKVGTSFCGKKVIALENLIPMYKSGRYKIVITSNKHIEIGENLEKQGIYNYRVYRLNEWGGASIKSRLQSGLSTVMKMNEKTNKTIQINNFQEKKYKVAFTYFGKEYDVGQKTLIEALIKDCHIQRIIMDIFETDLEDNNDTEMEYFLQKDYIVEKEKPDIFIYTVPDAYRYSDNLKVSHLREQGIFTILLNSATMLYGNTPNYVEDLMSIGIWNDVDIVINNTNFYGLNNSVELPNPKFDCLYEKFHNCAVSKEWSKKTNNKKVVLWNFVHGISKIENGGVYYDGVTFDYYLNDFFELTLENPDIVFLLRPHPALFVELVKYDYWSKQDLNKFKLYIEHSDNIILDETEDYGEAYFISDGLISDKSGLLVTYLVTGKPILYLPSPRDLYSFYHKDLEDSFYIGYSKHDIQVYLNQIKNGKDTKAPLRKGCFDKYIGYFDGKNGERNREYILSVLNEIVQQEGKV